jgi:copper chaperone
MIELLLPTMSCGHCERVVSQTVQRVDPAARLSVDLTTHRVRIDSSRPRTEFETALAEEGYAASSEVQP